MQEDTKYQGIETHSSWKLIQRSDVGGSIEELKDSSRGKASRVDAEENCQSESLILPTT